MEDFDGRDGLVKRAFQNDSLVAKKELIDHYIMKYTDPWKPAFYSQFDDVKPGKPVFYERQVDGVHGLKAWNVPVTGVRRYVGAAACYEQVDMGWLEIVEVPDIDGTSEMLMRIVEKPDFIGS